MPPVPCPEYLHESQVRRNHEKREKATALVALSSLTRRRNRLKRSYIVKICKLRPVKHYQLSTLTKKAPFGANSVRLSSLRRRNQVDIRLIRRRFHPIRVIPAIRRERSSLDKVNAW